MSEEVRNEAAAGENAAEKSGDVRKTRGIRFSESEWEEVKKAAAAHEMPAAEFVRERILALARAPASVEMGAVAGSMAPLVERMFRYVWFLATEKRDAMVREGREDEVDRLIAEARAFQQSLRKRCERPTLLFSLTPGRSSRAGVRRFWIGGGRRRSSPACS